MYTPHEVTLVSVTPAENGVDQRETTVLHGVMLQTHVGGTLSRGGVQSADNATLWIPVDVNATDLSGRPKTYLNPVEYAKQADKTKYWTLITSGKNSGMDGYFVRGIIDPREKTDYATLRQLGFEVYRISSCDYRDYGSKHMHHWQVGGQ